MSKYILAVEFETDRVLTSEEADYLMGGVLAQVEDPDHHDGISRHADYRTTIVWKDIVGG
jgi:hypothetical protein